MILLQANDLARRFADDTLYEGVSFNIQTQDRIALVGRNGAGKSTLIKQIMGQEPISDGSITKAKGLKIGYLAQHVRTEWNDSLSIWDTMLAVFQETLALRQTAEEAAMRLAELSDDTQAPAYQAALERYDQLQEALTQRNAYAIESDIRTVLHGFRFYEADYATPVSQLSGGQRTRLALARILLMDYDLLILDEPTNHLDMTTLAWLETYLTGYKGALLLVSHDRYFLDKVVNQVLELRHHRLHTYKGNYSYYVEEKALRLAAEEKAYAAQQATIQKLEDFVQRNLVRASTTKRAQSRRKQLEKMDRLEKPKQDKQAPRIQFLAAKDSGEDVLAVDHLAVGYEATPVAQDLNLQVRRQEAIALVGPNGVGKTTLAQVVAARSRRPAVYVVALAEVSPGADLARVVLDAIGGSAAVNGDPHRDLAAALSQPGTVLVLDNCEHLAGEVADLIGPLLVACPDLRVLATSRRPLDLAAEHVHRLEALNAASSAELFRARALAARPGQVIDDDDLGELLSRLEGIPLAIELAAARTRSLSVGQIAERLPGRPDLLTAARDAPARQRTLTAVIDWSWNLLDAAERRALARLALLADGFTLLPAEALIGAQAADLLDTLVSHSLLVVRDHGLPRFHMLVTVRDFALAQLSASGDEAEARAALRQWAVDLCSQIRFPVDAGDFGDARHPEARRHDRLFRQVAHDEAVILQQLDRLLAQADGHGTDHLPAELRDAICLIGAALMRLWSVTWSYERIADYGARLIAAAVQPAQDSRGNEAGLSVLALCVTLFGLLSHVPEQVRSLLPASFDGEGPFSRVRRFLRASDEQWPELTGDADPWVAWAATRCLAAQQEDDGDPQASLETIEALLGRLHGHDLAGIHLLELHLHRLQVLMSLGRYSQVVDACSRAQVGCDSLVRPRCDGLIWPRVRLAGVLTV